jgi:hypothetical protein
VPSTLRDFILHGQLPAPGSLQLQPEVVQLPALVDIAVAQRLGAAAAEQGGSREGGSGS